VITLSSIFFTILLLKAVYLVLRKVFNYEANKEWKFEGEIPCVVDFWTP
jgi:lysophospholipid acyltransferase (LPLAT)-like uncharacterized protein